MSRKVIATPLSTWSLGRPWVWQPALSTYALDPRVAPPAPYPHSMALDATHGLPLCAFVHTVWFVFLYRKRETMVSLFLVVKSCGRSRRFKSMAVCRKSCSQIIFLSKAMEYESLRSVFIFLAPFQRLGWATRPTCPLLGLSCHNLMTHWSGGLERKVTPQSFWWLLQERRQGLGGPA